MKIAATKATKDHEGEILQVFSSCTFVPLVVQDFQGGRRTIRAPAQ